MPTIKLQGGSDQNSNSSKILVQDMSKLSKMSSRKQSPLRSHKTIQENNEIVTVNSRGK